MQAKDVAKLDVALLGTEVVLWAEKGKIDSQKLMLAHKWTKEDVENWWMSEKLDGVRAYWDGRNLWSRAGTMFRAPEWWTRNFPKNLPLDGELFLGRGKFQETMSVVREFRFERSGPRWARIKFAVFDAPKVEGPFEKRMIAAKQRISAIETHAEMSFLYFHEHNKARNQDVLDEFLRSVLAQGGEGVMLRKPGSP